MGTRAHFYHSFSTYCFPWEDLHFRSSSSLYSYCGRCVTSACTAHSSVHFCVLSSPPHTLALSCLLFLFYYVSFLFLRPRALSLSRLWLYDFLQLVREFSCQWLCVRELNARCRLFRTVIPLYILLCAFVSSFYQCIFNANRKWNFCYLPCAFAIINFFPTYARILRRSSSLVFNFHGFYFAQIFYLLSFSLSRFLLSFSIVFQNHPSLVNWMS